MKEEIKFKLGDSVYFPYHGYGTIIGLHNDGREYPIEVRWEASPHGQEVNTFTKDGFLTHGWAEWNVPSDSKLRDQLTVVDKSPLKKAEEMAEESKFKVGDRVYAPFHKYGTIVEIVDTDASYPITVRWDESRYKLGGDLSTFTEDGYLFFGNKTENTKITKVEGEKMGQLSGVVAQNIERKMKEDNEKMSPDAEMFHVGDHVWSPHFGAGVVTGTTTTDENNLYPIKVEWCHDANPRKYDCFTRDGNFDISAYYPDMAIYSVEDDHAPKGIIERMEDELDKKVEDAVNPSHYKVEGLPEAIDIINHLMHREQYEGFLWGNILKYAYRFGRKGDKAETAGKIEWYAKQLKELEEEHK